MKFEWDPVKALSNLRKHGIKLEDAITAFDDPWALTTADEGHSFPSEEREWLIGESDGARILVVVFTRRGPEGGIYRIISARPAGRREREGYGRSKGISI